MPRHKAKRSPHSRYRDDPEDNRAGEIDRASLASKSRSVVRVDHDGNDGKFGRECCMNKPFLKGLKCENTPSVNLGC